MRWAEMWSFVQSDPWGAMFVSGLLLCVIGLLVSLGAWEKTGVALIVIGLLVATTAIRWMPVPDGVESRTSSPVRPGPTTEVRR